VTGITMSRKTCLDDPSRPHKSFRDTMVKRSRKDSVALQAKLTPTLNEAWWEYSSSGKVLSTDAAKSMRTQLGVCLETALDCAFDADQIRCEVCASLAKQRERQTTRPAVGTVRACQLHEPCSVYVPPV
jgi:hypothetical protein